MPPLSTAQNRVRVTGETTVIELSLSPIIQNHHGADPAAACHICASTFCRQGSCCRCSVHLACCTQVLCCKCLVRISKRCHCTPDCVAVIAFCPYCRDISGVNALDLYHGGLQECSGCREAEKEEEEDSQDGQRSGGESVAESAESESVAASVGSNTPISVSAAPRWSTYLWPS